MEFINLHRQYERIKDDLDQRLKQVYEHKNFIMGPEIKDLETKLAAYCGRKHALTCASGTDALILALMALKIGKGDAVFVPSFTFFATAECVSFLGATPVFVDSDDSFNLDHRSLLKAIQDVQNEGALKPRAIIPVDLFGLPADYDEIEKIAQKYQLHIIEDAAQGFGAEYHGKKTCGFGVISCASFFPAKPLGCYGDGGAVFTDDDDLAELIYSFRVHGQGKDRYDNVRIGLNARMDTLQAAVVLAKLEIFEDELCRRNAIAAKYTECLEKYYPVPFVPKSKSSCWAQYSLLAESEEQREEIMMKLKDKGIPTMIYYPIPLHLQTAFRDLGYEKGSLPVCENFSKHIFSIPMHPYLSEDEIHKITQALISAVNQEKIK